MTARRSVLYQRLASAPTIPLKGIFVRRVAQTDFELGAPRSYLFTSGAANRLNPAGVDALYLSEDEATALVEQEAAWSGLPGALEPTNRISSTGAGRSRARPRKP